MATLPCVKGRLGVNLFFFPILEPVHSFLTRGLQAWASQEDEEREHAEFLGILGARCTSVGSESGLYPQGRASLATSVPSRW